MSDLDDLVARVAAVEARVEVERLALGYIEPEGAYGASFAAGMVERIAPWRPRS